MKKKSRTQRDTSKKARATTNKQKGRGPRRRTILAGDDPRRELETLHTLVHLCGAAMISADQRGTIVHWNPEAQRLFGFSRDDAIGMPLANLIPPRLRKAAGKAFKDLASSREWRHVQKTITTHGLRADGSEVPIEITFSCLRCGEDGVFLAVARDITEQRDFVEKLYDALQKLRFHIERMPLAYVVWDAQLRVMEWNPAAERIFGYKKEEARAARPMN